MLLSSGKNMPPLTSSPAQSAVLANCELGITISGWLVVQHIELDP
jgi:hypothetical protein